ncbi:MAG: DUF309 domain-containing protein, partial [Pirellulales bacterium]
VSSRNHLESFRPHHMGVDLERLFEQFEECFAEVLASTEEFPKLTIDPELIPEIHLDPPART